MPTGARVVAWQDVDLVALGLTRSAAVRAVQWVSPNGGISAGAAAVGRLLVDAGWPWRVLGHLVLTPPLSWLAAVAYRLVAANRHRFPGGTPACALPPDRRPGAAGVDPTI